VIWLLEDRGETSSPVGRTAIGVLLFQDLAVIPVMLALPLLAGRGGTAREVLFVAVESVAVVAGVILAARFVVPWLCARIVATRSRELFTLTIVLIGLGTAVLLGEFGISMALGAFIAGMVISESDYVAQIVADMTPFRDVFNSLFFVSIGMLLDLDLWLERPVLLGALVAAVIAGKAVIAALSVLPAVRSLGTAVASGLALAQIGELAVVVAAEAARLGLVGAAPSGLFLAVTVPAMVVTPFVLRISAPFSRWIEGVRPGSAPVVDGRRTSTLADHVIVVGYGVNGRNVTRSLTVLDVPHVVVDLNGAVIREVVGAGGRAVFGDATREAVLQAAGVSHARAVIVALPDAAATRQVVATARRLAPAMTILARTRYIREVEPLEKLGADQVIPEEFETSIELTARVLRLYGASESTVRREEAVLRAEHYGALRGIERHDDDPTLEMLRELADLGRLEIVPDSDAVGSSLRDLAVREQTGATVVALDRAGALQPNPAADLELEAGDVLLVYGTDDQLSDVGRLLAGARSNETGSRELSNDT
jgi:CPA2 family monovalent cation:H+ antiporter-2